MRIEIRHGGHVISDTSARGVEVATMQSLPLMAAAAEQATTPFDYMFRAKADDPASRLPQDDPPAMVAALKALGAAMLEDPPVDDNNSIIPALYTYWGQFIDHDLTANTDRDSRISDITKDDLVPVPPAEVVENLRNLRDPRLELDSVYEDAPRRDQMFLKVGRNATGGGIEGEVPPDPADLERDLPRGPDKKAQIGDPRNDENLIVAQLHTAFLRFHNAAVDWVLANEAHYQGPVAVFNRAQQLTRWHHQWLVVHDYLETLTRAGTVDRVLLGGNRHYRPEGEPFMPLEFSVAAFRFGHSMIRAGYDHNRNFGRGAIVRPFASLNQLFQFTGNHNPPLGGSATLPFNWIIEWDRFVDKGSPFPNRFARRIDTNLAFPLSQMINEGEGPTVPAAVKPLLKQLAQRNLLRGYLLSLPTGQAVADAIGVAALTPAQVRRGDGGALDQALQSGGFDERTPLWYYVLKEAEVQGGGNTLGEVGSRVIAETLIGQLRHDAESYLNVKSGWSPAQGVRTRAGDLVVTIRDFLHFAGLPA